MAEALVKTFLGNVGIGTDDPGAYMLDVNGSATSGGSVLTPSLKIGLVNNAHVPYGLILIWSGSQASIPTGWALCDGLHDTPDLRDLFVIGGGQSYTAPNATGGANSITFTTSHIPYHAHTFYSYQENNNHNHYVQDNAHFHATYATDYGGRADGTTCQAGQTYEQQGFNSQFSLSGLSVYSNRHSHTHSYSSSYSGQSSPTPFDLKPAYYALCYMMKT
jgi:microcystin-dependent protein